MSRTGESSRTPAENSEARLANLLEHNPPHSPPDGSRREKSYAIFEPSAFAATSATKPLSVRTVKTPTWNHFRDSTTKSVGGGVGSRSATPATYISESLRVDYSTGKETISRVILASNEIKERFPRFSPNLFARRRSRSAAEGKL